MRVIERRRFTGNAATAESRALVAGAVAFLALGTVAVLLFGGRDIPLAGEGSIATVAAVGGALVGMAAFAVSVLVSKRTTPRDPGASEARRIFDLCALTVAHGLVALLLWLGLFTVLQLSFVGAIVYPVAAAVMVGGAGSATAYVAFLSAYRMDAYRLAGLLAVFMVSGMLASMLTASDPQWWHEHLSALGTSADASGYSFNITLVIGGALLTVLASFATASPSTRSGTVQNRHPLWVALTLVGVLLACVGLLTVDDFFLLHTIAASGMLVTYAVLVSAVRRFVPGASVEFTVLGYVFLGMIVVAAVLYFPIGYYNLTAVELIAGLLIFTWLIVLVRNLAADELDDRTRPGLAPASETGGQLTAEPPPGAPSGSLPA